ncbi:hypothetical protein HC028_26355 [Planosporangium flavigriseum]|uniref:Uncharacterized protein n=1 Tax=Planosporangium flavigriseum TaxID=373681 RepID=A0A8J3PP25_9ACTN|nr:hypothetical protein [Planosporangium flavigriseum]NJC68002.1 hypothetical protein [Planosporangium flavigriseum]GIG76607.1 hypothetical protein Pfl04_50110 [Planosporangium flavigriseum]
MRKSFKVAGGLAVAGIIAASGSAFTATGLATSGTAAAPQFVGGSISQTVDGADLSEIAYGFTDDTKTAVDSITLTFAAVPDGKTVTAEATGGNNGTFTCTNTATLVSTCTYAAGADTKTATTGITSLKVTVA